MLETTARTRDRIEVVDANYSAALRADAEGAVVDVRGTISTRNPEVVLNPFVERVHAALVEKGAKQVRIDMRNVEFLNSCGFKSFVYWVEMVQKLPEAQRYRLIFLSSPDQRWQKTSLVVLKCFAPSWVDIRV